jgi:hypothetical protein
MVKVGAPRQAAVQESFIEKLLQRAQLGWPLGANFGDGLVTSVRSLWENPWKTNQPLACAMWGWFFSCTHMALPH